MPTLPIAKRTIGTGQPVYVIAEIGVNHDGDEACAIELVRSAARAGADAVKFQYFEADRLMSRASKLAAYQSASGESDPIAMLRRLELGLDALRACIATAHQLGIHAIVSIFSVEHVASVSALAWDGLKTASPDIVNRPLLDAMAAQGKPLLVSTGAATLDEVAVAMEWLRESNARAGVFQCVSSYPTPIEDGEFAGIAALAPFGLPVGYSDHTPGVEAGELAVKWGACMLEKHFTHDPSARGPDHSASLTEEGLREYIRLARSAKPLAKPGTPLKRVLPRERDVRTVSRQSLVALRTIPVGTRICAEDLTIKRPGTGTPPAMLGRVIGAVAKRSIEADVPLVLEDIDFAAAVPVPERSR